MTPKQPRSPEVSASADQRRSHGRLSDAERLAQVEALHQQLAAGISELTSSAAWRRMLGAVALFHSYSWRNSLLILQQRPDATRVAGYTTWQALGRQVRRGEHGIAILAPVTYRQKDSNPDATSSGYHGEPVPLDQGVGDVPPRPRRVVGWRVARVFDIAQTDGEPLPYVRPQALVGEPQPGLYQALGRQVLTAGFDLLDEPPLHHAQALGETNFATRAVRIRPDLTPVDGVSTLLHELGHIKHEHGPGTCTDPRSRREVEAESTTFVVGQAVGLDTGPFSFPYVAGWAGADNAVAEVAATADRVVAVSRGIIDALPTAFVTLL